jgi:hypothetical protein
MAQQGNFPAAKTLSEIADKLETEFSTTPQTLMQGNTPVSALIGKRGETKILDNLRPVPDITMQDLGGSVQAIDKLMTPGGTMFPKTMTPDAVASNRVALGNLGLSRERLAMEKANTEAGIGAGKPPTERRAPEAYLKQMSGIANVSTAIDNYLQRLKSWSNFDLANPAARAEIGTAYNNTMLQLKEAYNLGVLNGPDYMILTTTLTDPTSLVGAITPNKAIEAQSVQLRKVLRDNAKNLARVNKQPESDVDNFIPSSAEKSAPSKAEIEAELRRRGLLQ